jgi:hypothetical protein
MGFLLSFLHRGPRLKPYPDYLSIPLPQFLPASRPTTGAGAAGPRS